MKKNKLLLLFALFFSVAQADIAIPTRDPFLTQDTKAQTATQPNITTLQSCWIPLYFAQAKNVASFISQKTAHILSEQGKVNYDQRSNQLWLKDDAIHITAIRRLISHLDQSGPQFLIKAKIINVDRQYQKQLGILFSTAKNNVLSNAQLQMDEPNTLDSAGQFTLTIARLSECELLNLQISALEQEGHAALISSPTLMTLNNEAAVIQSGAEIPYQQTTLSGATSVSFKKAVLKLKVTPEEMPNNRVLLHIALNQDKVSALTVQGVPAIQTQQITTQVIVQNHQTIVLGGILETTQATQKDGTPIAEDIPLVGNLFTHHTIHKERRELLIFITPSEVVT